MIRWIANTLHVRNVLSFSSLLLPGIFPIIDSCAFAVQIGFSLLWANNNGLQILRLYIPALVLSFWPSLGVCCVLILHTQSSWSRGLSSWDLAWSTGSGEMVSTHFGQQIYYFILFSSWPSTHIVHDDVALRGVSHRLECVQQSHFDLLGQLVHPAVQYTVMQI